MKNMYFVARNSALAALVFFTPVYSESWTEWLSGTPAVVVKPAGFLESTQKWLLENQGMVKGCTGALVMAYCTYRSTISLMKLYHTAEMNAIRSTIGFNKSIEYEKIQDSEDNDIVRAKLVRYKADLHKKWIFRYHYGLTYAAWANFIGPMSIANVFCLDLNLYGQGFVDNCVVGITTSIDGNFIVKDSRFKNHVALQWSTTFASFNNCLLGNIKQRGKTSVIIELDGTVVNGDIVFESPGFVVMDSTSVIRGSVINGTLIRG